VDVVLASETKRMYMLPVSELTAPGMLEPEYVASSVPAVLVPA
jgi:hypothetical protein